MAPSRPTSWSTQMCGSFERGDGLRLEQEAVLAWRSIAPAPVITFNATVRPRRVSRARYTLPIPPAPSSPITS